MELDHHKRNDHYIISVRSAVGSRAEWTDLDLRLDHSLNADDNKDKIAVGTRARHGRMYADE